MRFINKNIVISQLLSFQFPDRSAQSSQERQSDVIRVKHLEAFEYGRSVTLKHVEHEESFACIEQSMQTAQLLLGLYVSTLVILKPMSFYGTGDFGHSKLRKRTN
ncbi:hypothetical protein WJ89_03835 [Burkholderia ubonensis]|nr:hypothetical protein WJ89_03835 [Burkholderia ubonensis]KVQ85016.1 hypothetical protein WK06_07920 [Burkholderia ubonensis]KWD40742.1 hypothetical protein WL64_11655 [Burkholderia ubonensis]KWD41580.1 hypothetical protein WL63_06145 [Burkholderia ubonensis]KWO98990.1 hypothetical protein WM35_13165 [Burkholderia ubonensis]